MVQLKMTKAQWREYLLLEEHRGDVKNSFDGVKRGRFVFTELQKWIDSPNQPSVPCDLLSGKGDIGKHEYQMTAYTQIKSINYAYATSRGPGGRTLQFFECKTIMTVPPREHSRTKLIDEIVQLECSCRDDYDYEHHCVYIIYPQIHVKPGPYTSYMPPPPREYRDVSGWHAYTSTGSKGARSDCPPFDLPTFLRGFCAHLPKPKKDQNLRDQWTTLPWNDFATHSSREFQIPIKKMGRLAVNLYGLRFNWNQQRLFAPAVEIMTQMWFGTFFFDNQIRTEVSLDPDGSTDATRDRIRRESSITPRVVNTQRTQRTQRTTGHWRRSRVRLGPLIDIPCVLPTNTIAGDYTIKLHEAVMTWSRLHPQTFGTLEKRYGHSSRISACLNRAQMIRDLRIAPTLSTMTMRCMYSAYEQAKSYGEASTHYTARAMNRIVNRIIATTAKQTQSLQYLNVDDIAAFSADSDRYRWSDELITEGLRLLTIVTADL